MWILEFFFLKNLKVSHFRRQTSSLFHSIVVDGKKEFLKKLYLVLRDIIWVSK